MIYVSIGVFYCIVSCFLSHQQHLLDLKDTDPDFYQFLIENDEKLLNFSESEDEADMQSESGSTHAKEESDKVHTCAWWYM